MAPNNRARKNEAQKSAIITPSQVSTKNETTKKNVTPLFEKREPVDPNDRIWFKPLRLRHFQNLNIPMTIYISLIHVGSAFALTHLTSCKWQTLLFAWALWPISGMGITVGAHRLWAHRSYSANFAFRFILMVLNSIANQGSIFHWARDHRVHHKESETEADPHNATRGFFFAHVGWLLQKKDQRVIESGRHVKVDDLLADPLVAWQKKMDPWFALFMCFIFPALYASHFWGESFLIGFLIPGVLRYTVVLHATWLVNSLAHMVGNREYDPTIHPSENFVVSLMANGEGWHNWHHKFPFDYAASEHGISSRWNPSKLVIDAAAKIGWVTNRKRALNTWDKLKQQRQQ